jgi:heme/copper-type cytochrome/quinol oxidase subunit 2
MGEILDILTTLDTQQSRQELAQIVQAQSDQIAQQELWLAGLSVILLLLFVVLVGVALDTRAANKKAQNLEKRLDAVLLIGQNRDTA